MKPSDVSGAPHDPVKRALRDLVASLGPDKVVFRHADGSPITAEGMGELLDQEDPIAADFLRDLYATALALLRARAG